MKVKNIIAFVSYLLVLVISVTYIFTCSEGLSLNVFLVSERSVEITTEKSPGTTKEYDENTTKEDTTEEKNTVENITEESTTEGNNAGETESVTTEQETTTEKVTEPETTTSEADNYDYYYNDGKVRIAITEVVDRKNSLTYYVADVQLASVEYFQSLFAYGKYSTNLRQGTTDMAEMAGAIFAVSGDYYNQRSNSVVIRNGVLYSEDDPERDILVMYENGDMEVIPSGQCPSGEELIDMGVINSYSFGPGIVEDGKAVEKVRYTSDYIKEKHPRMLIGQIDTLHYLFVAVDGRRDSAVGMDIYECADLMESLGCEVAYNLDGGGSTTMVFMGEIVNVPSQGSERSISDAIGILGGDS